MRLATVIAAEAGAALLPVLTAALSGAPLLSAPLALAGMLDAALLLIAMLPLLTSQGVMGDPDVPVDGTEVSAVAACCAAVAKGDASITSDMGTSKSELPCSFADTSAPAPSAVSSKLHLSRGLALLCCSR